MLRFFAVLLAAASLAAAVDYHAEGRAWWAHIEYLASDAMEGRDTGSEGYRKASEYVAGAFAKDKLKPGGEHGYFQPVKFEVKKIVEARSSLTWIRDGARKDLKLGGDAVIAMAGDAGGDTEAEAVFTGYGLRIPEAHYDDFADVDLHGKIAVYLMGAPKSIAGALAAHSQSLEERWKALKAAGAIGIAAIPNPASSDIPWDRAALSRFMPSMSLAGDPALDPAAGLKLALRLNPAKADEFLEGTGHTITEILALAKSGGPMPHFPLKGTMAAHVTVERSKAESPNVVGVWPGSDAKLKDQYVVLSAHLDHVGIGEQIHGDSIYNGAMDDASGIATVLETARRMAKRHLRPRRSLIFLAVCGEEKGELGSQYFAAHPTVPLSGIAADLNLDMFLPLVPLRALEVQGLDESTLGDAIRASGAKYGVTIEADQHPQRNGFIRSDQYSFIKRGVPSLAFKFGFAPGTPEEKIFKDWLTNRYHAPSDDLSQPVNLEAAAKFDEVILDLLMRVANEPARPEWKADSFFRRFAF